MMPVAVSWKVTPEALDLMSCRLARIRKAPPPVRLTKGPVPPVKVASPLQPTNGTPVGVDVEAPREQPDHGRVIDAGLHDMALELEGREGLDRLILGGMCRRQAGQTEKHQSGGEDGKAAHERHVLDPPGSVVHPDIDGIAAQAEGDALALRLELHDDALLVLKPEPAIVRLAQRDAQASLGIGAG